MKILLSHSNYDRKIKDYLQQALCQDGHTVYSDSDYNPGEEWRRELGKRMLETDVFVPIVTEHSQNSHWISFELGIVSSNKDKEITIIPIAIGIAIGTQLPPMLNQYQMIFCDNDSERELDDAIEKLKVGISAHEARKEQKLERIAKQHEESVKKFHNGITEHIKPVFEKLEEDKKENKKYAIWLYLTSVLVLLVPVFLIYQFSKENLSEIEVQYVIFKGIIYFSAMILFISLSKLLFTLAKSFMVESIRCSDRAHAISFGRFFLDAYEDTVTHEEVIKVFNSWNIDNGSTQFRNQSGEDYDPKLGEILGKSVRIK